MKLLNKTEIDLLPFAPFNFDPTFHKPDHFTTGDNLCEPGTKWQTWKQEGLSLGLKFNNMGSINRPKIELSIFSSKKIDLSTIKELVAEIKYRYNLDFDLKDFYLKFSDNKLLKRIISDLEGMRPGHPSSLYEYLIIGIVLQNASVRRSIQMFKTLLEKYGEEVEFDGQKLWCFWEPGRLQNVSEGELRTLKIGYRAKYIKKIDDQFHHKLIDEIDLRSKSANVLKEELLKLFGVGPATVWYLLFDVFHHWEIFDHISPWEQKIYSKLFFDQDPENPVVVEKLLKFINQFGKYKHLAVHYLWEDLWWRRKKGEIFPWFEKEIRL